MKSFLLPPRCSFFFGKMRNRLIVASAMVLASATAGAAVIDFNNSSDLADFNQTTSTFWVVSSGVGLGGTAALTGSNYGTPGWLTYTNGFDAKATSVSSGIYIKLAQGSATAQGFALVMGVSSSTNYIPNVVSEADNTKNHYSVALHYNNATPRRFRVQAQRSTDGTYAANVSDYTDLAYDSWYYLSLESTLDLETSLYTVNAKLYSSSNTGVIGTTPIVTASLGSFEISDLTDASKNYFFFGLDGRAETRGVVALDNFTYDVIPEPSVAGLVILSGAGILGARRLLKK